MRAAVHMLRQQQRVMVWGFWALALCVAVLSLMPTNYLPAQVFSLWDKAQHALAFTALASLGRWSLSWYMLHQPVLMGLLMLWAWMAR